MGNIPARPDMCFGLQDGHYHFTHEGPEEVGELTGEPHWQAGRGLLHHTW